MKNGDVITGVLGKIEDDKVYIDPAYADEFSVKVAEVASINAEKVFELELEDGSEVSATFAGATSDGRQTLIVDDAEMDVVLATLAMATPPQAYYERESHVDLNATWNGGNTDNKNNLLFADTRLRVGDHRHLAELYIARDETNDISTKKQDLLRYSYNWLFNEPWYLGVTASYERDPIKLLDHRYVLGALIGRDIFKDSRKFLTISVGMGYSHQELALESDGGATGLWNLDYEHDFRNGDLTLFHNQNFGYQFYGNNNMVIKTNTGFRFDVYKDVYTSVSFLYNYETEPARTTVDHDSTLAIGIGAKF